MNSYFKHLYQEEIENKEFKKQLYKEINLVKNDIINNTLTCDEKYHRWLKEKRYKIVPEIFETSYYYDIKITPYKYLKLVPDLLVKFYFIIKKNNIFIVNISIKILVK